MSSPLLPVFGVLDDTVFWTESDLFPCDTFTGILNWRFTDI